ncbi:MAG: type 4a pilus biogenesis protein PilO [Phycisphaerae bacterium]
MKFGTRELVFVVLLMAIPVGAWWFVFKPRNERNQQLLSQVEARRAKLRQVNQATATVGDLKREIGELREAIGYFQSKLPDEKEIEKVLREMWTLAEANRMTPKSIRPSSGGKPQFGKVGNHSEQVIAVKLEGSFRGLYSFLQDLENQPRITRILDMTVVPKRGSDEMVVTFTMVIFFERN